MIAISPPAADRTAVIRARNDALRQRHLGGRVMLTPGIRALGLRGIRDVLAAVAAFDRFKPGNDPYAEHDFGAVNVSGQRVFFKIDAYDRSLAFASPDPTDPAVTVRVMTVMLAEEY